MTPKHLEISDRQLGKTAWSSRVLWARDITEPHVGLGTEVTCISVFSGVAVTNQHTHGSLNNKKVFSHSSLGSKSKVKCALESSLPKTLKRMLSFFHLLLASCDPRHCWLRDNPLQSACVLSLCVSLPFTCLSWDPCCYFQDPLIQSRMVSSRVPFYQNTGANTPFCQTRSHSWVLRAGM